MNNQLDDVSTLPDPGSSSGFSSSVDLLSFPAVDSATKNYLTLIKARDSSITSQLVN